MESTSTFRCLTEKWLMYRCKQAVVNTNYFTDSWVQNTVECRYNAFQYSEILHKWLQELRQNINQMLNKKTTDELWGVFCWYCWENRPRYNGTALYLIVDIGCNYKTNGDQRVSSTTNVTNCPAPHCRPSTRHGFSICNYDLCAYGFGCPWLHLLNWKQLFF